MDFCTDDVCVFKAMSWNQQNTKSENKSIVELVPSGREAKETQTKMDYIAKHADLYGDMEASVWPTRQKMEQAFTTGQGLSETWIQHGPKNGMPVGINEKHAFFLVGNVDQYSKAQKAKQADAYAQSLEFRIRTEVKTKQEAKDMIALLTYTAKVDDTLKTVIQAQGKRLTELLHALPEEAEDTKAAPDPLEGGPEPVSMHRMPLRHGDEICTGTEKKETSSFRILRLTSKKTGYVDCGIDLCPSLHCIPSVAVSEHKMAVLYQPPYETGPNLWLDVFAIQGNGRLKKEQRIELDVPKQLQGSTNLTSQLTDQDMYVLTFANGCMVLDLTQQIKGVRVFMTESQTITSAHLEHTFGLCRDKDQDDAFEAWMWNSDLDQEKGPPIPPWSGALTLASQRGVVYTMDWRTGKSLSLFSTPAIEPVFATQRSNNVNVAMTIVGLTIQSTKLQKGVPTHMFFNRPVAFAMRGTLVFVLTKYGDVVVISTRKRGASHRYPAPTNDVSPWIAYPAIWCGAEKVRILYPNGFVREIYKDEKK